MNQIHFFFLGHTSNVTSFIQNIINGNFWRFYWNWYIWNIVQHYLNSLLEYQAFLRVILTRSMYLSRTFLTPTRKSRMVPIRPQLVSYLAESNGHGWNLQLDSFCCQPTLCRSRYYVPTLQKQHKEWRKWKVTSVVRKAKQHKLNVLFSAFY